jgi:pilus assembly protein CpaE
LAEEVEQVLGETRRVMVIRKLDQYPQAVDMVRLLRALAPRMVLLSLHSLSQAAEVIAAIEQTAPGIQVIAINRTCEPQLLLEAMRLGIREFLSPPFEATALADTLGRVEEALERRPPALEATEMLFSFLPAKPGVGTSTIAMNVAGALARQQDKKVLLSDFDLNSGMVRFMLKLQNPYCIVDAAENATKMDENQWPQLVTEVGKLDVLHAGKLNPAFRMESIQVRRLIEFARRNYKVICADLSGNLEKYSLEIMQESKRIFLVCTPEVPALHLAREKYRFLKDVDLGDRVSLIVNRCERSCVVSPEQIEELLTRECTRRCRRAA